LKNISPSKNIEVKIMTDKEFYEFWGEPISVYSDKDAQEDGILTDISEFGVKFNGKTVNRVTSGARLAIDLKNKQTATAKNNLQFIADNSVKDSEGAEAWGVFEGNPKLCDERLWLVTNEIGGYTLMLPSEY
jgi:type I site-specific restriction endonuclease